METTTGKKTSKAGETLKIIYKRRAVRKFKDKPVERNLIEQVIDAGRMAPSAINRQPWKFYILTKKETIKAFSKEIAKSAAKGIIKTGVKGIAKTFKDSIHMPHGINFLLAEDPIFHGAPVVIFITAPKENEWASLDVGMCAQNMMLAAEEMGLSTCPVGLGKFVEETKNFSKLRVPQSEEVLLAVILGYGDETPEVHERIKDNVVFIDPA
ncbi:MAG TPA: nitroreductase [Bacteroidia bacterium]|nr:nitroreductase [Bacteroidia bacterium]